MVGERSKVFELPFSGALLGRESARSLASKATLLTDVSRRHWWSGEKQPPGDMENSLVLLFEVTFRFQAACFRHTAPPNVRMAKFSRHTIGLYSRSLKNLARQQSQNSPKSAFTGSQRPICQSGATVGVRGFCENGSSVGSPPSQRLAWILRHKSDRWAPRSDKIWRKRRFCDIIRTAGLVLSRGTCHPNRITASPDPQPAIPSRRLRFRWGTTLCRPQFA